MQTLSHQTRCFDGFTLDLTRGCLLRGAQEIKLRPKPFEALKYLVDNPGRLISKTELIEVIWPDTAVTDDSLVQCLIEVRRALGDDAQQVIKTVPRRGYIFDRPVSDTASITPVTTVTEESGVHLIIEEEETNGHGGLATAAMPVTGSVTLVPAYQATTIQRVRTAIGQHKWTAVVGALAITLFAAAGIFYLTKPTEAIDSVAVMPFVNVNGDPNTEYLSDGLSESIINSLSPNLKVIALNSVLRYKGKDPQTIGRELNVRSVLMGRVTQHGDDLIINVELVDARDNRHLWGEQYNRKLADIAEVPTEIAQKVSEKLRLRLTGDEKQRLAKRYTQSGEAYQLYMLGRYYFRLRRGKEGLDKSIDYFEQAIKKDPTYAPAYAGMGENYRLLGWVGWLPAKEAREKEEWATLKALQIDDALAEAHVLKANLKEIELDWPAAEEEYKRALQLDPNSVRAHNTYAWHLEIFGRFDEAKDHLTRAEELDPFELEVKMDIATLFSFTRQYDRAIEQFKKTIEMDPSYPGTHLRLAGAYEETGRYEDAIAELKKGIVQPAQLAYGYAVAGKREEAQEILEELKQQQSSGHYVSPFFFAIIYLGLGEKDQAFEWLNKTFEENPYKLAFIRFNARFDSLRSDPRFDALLRRMKLVT
jgi:TolB-like protein/DNA-binding winged helix-turn-helix (wHTH) protein/Flp pilus assembly protein TadD